jgi:hypothetical protein
MAGGSNLDSLLRLMNSSGTQVASNDDGGGNTNSLISFVPTASGTYYVSAGGYASSTGAYSLSASASGGAASTPTPTPSGDIVGSTSTTSSLALNSSTGGTIDGAGDQDWFSIFLNAGTTYTFRQSMAGGSNLDSLLRLMNSSGTQVASNDDGGGNTNSLVSFVPTASGTYYVSAGGYASSTGAYSLSASASGGAASTPTPTPSGDIVGSTSTTSSLALNSSTGGTIDGAGDQDWFSIFLNAGTTYTFRQSMAGGSNLDSLLRLMNSSGTQVASNDDGGGNTNSLISFVPTASGTYYVSAGGYASSTGAYSLSASASGGAASTPTPTPSGDIVGSTSTTSSLALNSSTGGTIDGAGDQDWFSIFLNAGTTYTFRQSMAGGSNLDSLLRLMNSSGTQVASNDDGGGNTNSLISFVPTASGTYYVSAGGYASSTGAYSLSASASGGAASTPTPTPSGDIVGSTSTTSSLALNSSTGGTIDGAGDQDWFSIFLNAGTTYTFRQSMAGGSNLDSLLRLMNSSGTQVASNDDGGGNTNSLVSFVPTASGTYYVSAGGYASSTGAYSLSASASGGAASTPTESQVLWGVRDLEASFIGAGANHHFLVVLPSNPNDLDLTLNGFLSYDLDNDGTLDGFTIGADIDFLDNTLDVYTSKASDIAAIRGEPQDRFGDSWDYEFHSVPTPTGRTTAEFIDVILNAYISYRNYQASANWWDEIEYELSPRILRGGEGNCASWVNTILQVAGLSSSQTEAISDFSGVDWGENHEISLVAYQPIGDLNFLR